METDASEETLDTEEHKYQLKRSKGGSCVVTGKSTPPKKKKHFGSVPKKDGYLLLHRSKKVLGSWKQVYVVIGGTKIQISRNKGCGKSLAEMDVIFCSAKLVQTKKNYAFEIHTPQKTYLLATENGPEMVEWITTITEAQSNLMGTHLNYDGIASSESDDEDNEQQKHIADLLSINDTCADCKTPNPLWASINLGVFICIDCSGCHRKLGTHISQVRSVTMDKWETSVIDFMKGVGNCESNAYWEKNIPDGIQRLQPKDKPEKREKWIQAKYVLKEFC
eukprot:TRINITY_DN11688_c0_g1_i1.p1 TRINITY_DN11688_c0_g1~~TRINITY_DN11688_c0_g1_i1.p1  ORF type:complete len:278 (-),score=32.74 TRINITY_DN11688_c0_g1_i1:99-932(-)